MPTNPTTYPVALALSSCRAALEAIEQGDPDRAKGIIEDLADGIGSFPREQEVQLVRRAGRPATGPVVLCPTCGAVAVRAGRTPSGSQRYQCSEHGRFVPVQGAS